MYYYIYITVNITVTLNYSYTTEHRSPSPRGPALVAGRLRHRRHIRQRHALQTDHAYAGIARIHHCIEYGESSVFYTLRLYMMCYVYVCTGARGGGGRGDVDRGV